MKEVSLYIPCFNAAQYLDRAIPAVMEQTYPIKEVLIIDDGSNDDTMKVAGEFISGQKYPVRIVRHKSNLGLGSARNTGVKESRSEYVASLDSDVVPEKDWLKNLMHEFDNHNIAGAGGCLMETYTNGIGNHWRNTFMRQSHGTRRKINPRFLFGSNTVFEKKSLTSVGLYDEKCRTNGEDFDISKKIKGTGKLLIYNPDARCYHLRQDTYKSIMRTYWRWCFYGNWHTINLPRTIQSSIKNFGRTIFLHLRKDLLRLDFMNLLIDLSLPFYSSYRDWKAYFEHKKKKSRDSIK